MGRIIAELADYGPDGRLISTGHITEVRLSPCPKLSRITDDEMKALSSQCPTSTGSKEKRKMKRRDFLGTNMLAVAGGALAAGGANAADSQTDESGRSSCENK